jgi:hypothetical protein
MVSGSDSTIKIRVQGDATQTRYKTAFGICR